MKSDSALSKSPSLQFSRGSVFEVVYGSLSLQPVDLLALQLELTGIPANKSVYFQAFHGSVARFHGWISLRWQLSNSIGRTYTC
jgi:hypothetical protein